MAWPQLQLDSWDHFLRITSHTDFGPVATFPYLFRGQANATWTLKPSLGRQLPANCSESDAARIEEDCRIKFAEQAHLHISLGLLPNANDKPTWWGLMQHHHAPTRLLDWTASPFVAAYFTVVDSWDSDGAIWLFHAKTLLDESRNRPADPASAVRLFLPPNPPHRLIAQQGRFIYHD